MNSEEEKSRTVARIRSLDNVIKGSVYEMKRYCGKIELLVSEGKTASQVFVSLLQLQGQDQAGSHQEGTDPGDQTPDKGLQGTEGGHR